MPKNADNLLGLDIFSLHAVEEEEKNNQTNKEQRHNRIAESHTNIIEARLHQ